jgi:SulP family sulfate permease
LGGAWRATRFIDREFAAQGISNMVSSFCQCFPSSGLFTRSAINHGSGAKTRLAGILSGASVAVILVMFASYAKFIPNASLAGVIVAVAYQMIDGGRGKCVSGRRDAVRLRRQGVSTG